MSRAPLSILVSGHGHRLEYGHCFNCNGLEYMSYAGGFDPAAGVPPVGLSLAVLRLWLVLNVFRLVNAVNNQGGFSFGSFQQWRFHVVEDCLNILRRFDELLPGGWAPRLTVLLSGFLCSLLLQ